MYSLSYSAIKFNISSSKDDFPLIDLDREQMVRVFTNLIANSVDSLDGGGDGEIEFFTSILDNYKMIRVEVKDNGSGIPDKVKKKVLEPYFSTKKHGTGLGLAIVNQIVSDHGGYLRITDNFPKGTVVAIELPYSSKGNENEHS